MILPLSDYYTRRWSKCYIQVLVCKVKNQPATLRIFTKRRQAPSPNIVKTTAKFRWKPYWTLNPRDHSTQYCPLTQSELLARVRRQREAEHGHGGDQQARHDQVEEVVEGPPPDLDGEGDVQVGLRAAVVDNFVSFRRDALIEIIKLDI